MPETPLASLDLLRRITDRHVLDQLLAAEGVTRAEIAARTGISKPTISESMRRLLASGLVSESGQQVGRRGRAGTYFTLRPEVGVAVAVAASPDGLIVRTCDVRGKVVHEVRRPVPSPVTEARLNPLLADAVSDTVRAAPGPVLAAAISVAGPVDRETGQLVRLPDSPFLIDALHPRDLLEPLLGTALTVDNDVNWAAFAEARDDGTGLDDFCYLHLGHGLGGAVVRGGEVVRGRRGLAGEIAHVSTRGPGGRAMRLIECFGAWDLLQPGSAAIDVPRVREVLAGGSPAHRRVRDQLVTAVALAVGSITALLNPAVVLVGGPWGTAPGLLDRLTEAVAVSAVVRTELRPARLGDDGPVEGARMAAVREAQGRLLDGPPTG